MLETTEKRRRALSLLLLGVVVGGLVVAASFVVPWLLSVVRPYFVRYGYTIVFVGTLLENSAFVGAVVPGDVVLLLAGFYAERGALDLPEVMGLAFAGAMIGDSIGYLIGRLAGRRIVDRFGDRFFLPEKRLARVERYFSEYGVWAVAIGRFAPGVRTVNTFAAGMSRMPFPRFFGAILLAAAVWSALVPALGFAFGGSLELVRRSLGVVGIVALILFVGLVVFSYRRMVRRLSREERFRRHPRDA